MNHFDDQGVILSVRPHGEGGAVVHILTENHGKCGGYVNGAQSSSRLKSTLQIGNHVQCSWQSKTDGQLGRFDIEADFDITAIVMGDGRALLAVQSLCGLLDMFLPDREDYSALYHGTVAFLHILKTDAWLPAYIMWEVAFLREMGYGIDISKCAVCGRDDHLTHISPKSGRAVCHDDAQPYIGKLLAIPQFMQGNGFVDGDISTGLKLTEYFLVHRLLQHSTYKHLPPSRTQLENAMDSA